MLDEVPPKKLKTLVIPTKENGVVLLILLKSFDGLDLMLSVTVFLGRFDMRILQV